MDVCVIEVVFLAEKHIKSSLSFFFPIFYEYSQANYDMMMSLYFRILYIPGDIEIKYWLRDIRRIDYTKLRPLEAEFLRRYIFL